MSTRADKKLILLGLILCLLLVALPAYAQDATAEVTVEATNTSEAVATWTPDASEATAEATTEATVELTAEATEAATEEAIAEPTEEATAEAATEVTITATPESDAEQEVAAPGLSSGILLIGVLAVLAVGGVALMRERGGKPEDKV
jgi:hypothetical protein